LVLEKAIEVLSLPVLIVFSIDPDTSLMTDNTYKTNYRDTASEIDDKGRDKSSNNNRIRMTNISVPTVNHLI
jgi:hypothetical protein